MTRRPSTGTAASCRRTSPRSVASAALAPPQLAGTLPQAAGSTSRLRCLLRALALSLALGAVLPAAAGAVNVFTLDGNASGFGDVAVDAAGTGYFAWLHHESSADTPKFCKVARGATCTSPQILSMAGVPTPGNAPNQLFALLPASPANTVYVVGPRYVPDNMLILWTSSDGGASFGAPRVLTSQTGYVFNNPQDVLLSGANVFVGSTPHFASAPLGGPAPALGMGVVDFPTPGGYAVGSSLGLLPSGLPVLAYGANPNSGSVGPSTLGFYANTGGDPNQLANWTNHDLGPGITPILTGGPLGLFLLSARYHDSAPTSSSTADQVDVQKYDPVSGTFAAPTKVETDPSPGGGYGGRLFQTPGTGRLLLAYPGARNADNRQSVQLFSSTDGGQTWSGASDVGLGGTFVQVQHIRMAATDAGQGFMTFSTDPNGSGLQVADLTSTTTPAPPPVTPPTTAPPGSLQLGRTSVVAGTIVINAMLNRSGTVLAAAVVINIRALVGSVAKRAKGCTAGRVLVKVGQRKKCVSSLFGTSSTKIPAAGTYPIRLAPNVATRKALSKGKTLHVKETLLFTPTGGGAPVIKTINVTVKGKAKKKH